MDQSLVIAGSGRSGTTWILDVIANAANLRTVFEPFHPAVGGVTKDYANQYIAPDADPLRLRPFMDQVFRGELRGLWTDYRVIPDRLLPTTRTFVSPREALALCRRYSDLWRCAVAIRRGRSKGLAVKFIRANLMLEWIRRNYDVKVIFVLRHPCAVIESKLRLDAAARNAGLSKGANDWDPYPLLKRYLEDDALGNSFLDRYKGDIGNKGWTPAEAQALIWCIENIPVLGWAQNDDYCLVHYENLVVAGQEEWLRISETAQIEAGLADSGLNKPSQQASDDFRKTSSLHAKISRWVNRLSEHDKHSVQKILDLFGLQVYSAFDAMPIEPENKVSS